MMDERISLRPRRAHVYTKFLEFGILVPDVERDFLAHELRPDEEVLAVVRGRVPLDFDGARSRGEGIAVATSQRVLFGHYGHRDESSTCFLPLAEVDSASRSSVAGRPSIRINLSDESSVYITFAEPEFAVARFLAAVNEAAARTNNRQKSDERHGEEVPLKVTANSDSSSPKGTTLIVPTNGRVDTSSTPNGRNQYGESTGSGCVGCVCWTIIALVGLFIIGLIANECFVDESDNLYGGRNPNDIRTPTPTSAEDGLPPGLLTDERREAYREAQRYGLDTIAAANGITPNRLAHLMIREAVEVKFELKRYAADPNRARIVRTLCYNNEVNFHRPQVLRSGLATHCADLVDELK